MMTKVYDSSIFKKWEYLISNIITIGKKDDEEIFIRNFSIIVVFGFGTSFFQLRDGYALQNWPELLRSILCIGFLFVTLCYSKILIFDQKKAEQKSTNPNMNLICNNSIKNNGEIKNEERLIANNYVKYDALLDNKFLFEEDFIIILKEIIENLGICKTKQYAYLLFCIKEKMFLAETDVLVIEQFNAVFSVNISPQFFSQIKNEIEDVNTYKDLPKSREKYYKLYKDIVNSF